MKLALMLPRFGIIIIVIFDFKNRRGHGVAVVWIQLVELTRYVLNFFPAGLRLDQHLVTSGNKILVIDDNQMLCVGIGISLKASNYSPYFAHNAGSALSAALTEVPNLIILDIGLPGHDGYWVMQSFKEFPRLADVPVIVLTALDRVTRQRRCLDARANRYFQKPVATIGLMTAIRQLVG